METFSALLAICAGNSPVPGEFAGQRPVTRSFDVFFDMRLNKRLSKQLWGWWFETLSRPLWRHRNVQLSTSPCGWLQMYWHQSQQLPRRSNTCTFEIHWGSTWAMLLVTQDLWTSGSTCNSRRLLAYQTCEYFIQFLTHWSCVGYIFRTV